MPKPLACPSCRATMDKRPFGRHPAGEVILDVCWDCKAIWFDQFESAALSSRAVIDLFRLIHDHRDKPSRPLASAMGCPICRKGLRLTQDIQRTNRISYYRCPDAHGRLTSFLQFLREKQFVRSLSRPEIESLRASVKQVRCTGCGGTVDLAKDSACPYCRSPVSVLDADAVDKALASLSAAERQGARPDAEALSSAFESILATHKDKPRQSPWLRDISPSATAPVLVDLVVDGIGWLFE